MYDKTRIGVFAMVLGTNLFRNFVELPECDVVAQADRDRDRLAQVERFIRKLRGTTDYRDCSVGDRRRPNRDTPVTHFPIARDVCPRVHVLVEKPLRCLRGTRKRHHAQKRGGLV